MSQQQSTSSWVSVKTTLKMQGTKSGSMRQTRKRHRPTRTSVSVLIRAKTDELKLKQDWRPNNKGALTGAYIYWDRWLIGGRCAGRRLIRWLDKAGRTLRTSAGQVGDGRYWNMRRIKGFQVSRRSSSEVEGARAGQRKFKGHHKTIHAFIITDCLHVSVRAAPWYICMHKNHSGGHDVRWLQDAQREDSDEILKGQFF